MPKYTTDWLCIECGEVLGEVKAGELYPAKVKEMRTQGPNFIVICDKCGFNKVWYTSDPVVRSIRQLVDTISDEAARAMIHAMGKAVREEEKKLKKLE